MVGLPVVIRGEVGYSASRNAAFPLALGHVVTLTRIDRSTLDLFAIVLGALADRWSVI